MAKHAIVMMGLIKSDVMIFFAVLQVSPKDRSKMVYQIKFKGRERYIDIIFAPKFLEFLFYLLP